MHATLLRIVRCLPLALLPGLVGCNVAEYEQRMLHSQALLKQLDEEQRLLESPCEIPGPKDGSPPGDIFFRPPRGINIQSDNRETPRGGIVYRYPRTTPTPPAPPPQPDSQPQPNPPPQPTGDNPALQEVFVAYKADPEGKGFIDEVMKQFPHSGGESAKKPRKLQAVGREPLEAEVIEFADGKSSYLAVFHRTANFQVAILYRADLGKLASMQRTLDVSLNTLAVGEEANRVRQVFTDDDSRRAR